MLRADDAALRAVEEAVQTAQRASSDIALIFAEYALGVALLYRDGAADRHRGLELMVQAREWQPDRMPSLVPLTELCAARETARRDDRDGAIPVMRKAVGVLHQAGQVGYDVFGTRILVETLLERGAEGDWPKPKRRSTGWRTCPMTVQQSSRSRCCGYVRCWPGPAATRLRTVSW